MMIDDSQVHISTRKDIPRRRRPAAWRPLFGISL
jgi:hypothetical protein